MSKLFRIDDWTVCMRCVVCDSFYFGTSVLVDSFFGKLLELADEHGLSLLLLFSTLR